LVLQSEPFTSLMDTSKLLAFVDPDVLLLLLPLKLQAYPPMHNENDPP
jgi:hypothetical protein